MNDLDISRLGDASDVLDLPVHSNYYLKGRILGLLLRHKCKRKFPPIQRYECPLSA
jgi:hypothetical protein